MQEQDIICGIKRDNTIHYLTYKMIQILYTTHTKEWPKRQWNTLLGQLPESLQKDVIRFHRWQDRQASLLGKLLLKEGLRQLNYAPALLRSIEYTEYKRPYIEAGPHFSISHSGEYVICALSSDVVIGIDIEKIRPVRLSDFKSVLCSEEQQAIFQSKNRARLFCTIWTKKEAAIKAEGKGFYNRLNTVCALKDVVELEGVMWKLQKIEVSDDDYCCYIATKKLAPTSIKQINSIA